MNQLTITDKATIFDDKVRKGIYDSFKGIIDISYDDLGNEKCSIMETDNQVDINKVEIAIKFISERNMARLPDKHIEFLLGRLRILSKKKENDSNSEASLIKAYCEYLRNYPADILTEVLQDFPRIWASRIRSSGFKSDFGWFPSVAEIMAVIDDRLEFRKSFLSCLNSLKKNQGILAITNQRDKQKDGFTHFDEIFSEKMAEYIEAGDHFLIAGKKANDYVNKLKGVK